MFDIHIALNNTWGKVLVHGKDNGVVVTHEGSNELLLLAHQIVLVFHHIA